MNEEKFVPQPAGQNWDELTKWGIVALRKYSFGLDQFAKWLAEDSKELDKWAVNPFTGNALPWSVTTIVNLQFETLFSARPEEIELNFEPVVLVFKDAECKARFDAVAESQALF